MIRKIKCSVTAHFVINCLAIAHLFLNNLNKIERFSAMICQHLAYFQIFQIHFEDFSVTTILQHLFFFKNDILVQSGNIVYVLSLWYSLLGHNHVKGIKKSIKF